MRNADMPAMPLDSQAEGDIAQGYRYSHAGLTKREYFAAMAMQRILATDELQCMSPDITARAAIIQADALLQALEETS